MATIEISTELYRKLQSIAVPFEEKTPEDVIWRLVRENEARSVSSAAAPHHPAEEGLSSRGGKIPDGLALRLVYRGRTFPSEVRDGRIWVVDQGYESPSAAASAAVAAMGWPSKSLNGWFYWEYLENKQKGAWKRLMDLRDEAQVERRGR